jgi:hypothetical protein
LSSSSKGKRDDKEWAEKMDERKGGMRVSKIEKDVEDLTAMVAELLERNPARGQEDKPRPPIIFEKAEGRAAFEEESDAASTLRRALYGKQKALKDLNDVATAGYEAEGDVFADLHVLHADMVRRRSRYEAIERRYSQGADLTTKLLKALPWIVSLVVGSLLVYGLVVEPSNFQFVWLRIASDVRLQVVLGSTVAIVVGAFVLSLWRSKRKPKE